MVKAIALWYWFWDPAAVLVLGRSGQKQVLESRTQMQDGLSLRAVRALGLLLILLFYCSDVP